MVDNRDDTAENMSSPVGPVQEQYPTVHGAGPQPVNVAEYERYAQSVLPKNAFDYYASGSNDMITLRENRDAFARLRLMPKILVDVSSINIETTILGEKVAMPIVIAPTAMQRMAHNDGECATSRAAARHRILMTLSSWSTTALEDVAKAGMPFTSAHLTSIRFLIVSPTPTFQLLMDFVGASFMYIKTER